MRQHRGVLQLVRRQRVGRAEVSKRDGGIRLELLVGVLEQLKQRLHAAGLDDGGGLLRRRAGRLGTGLEKTAAALRAGRGVMLLAAYDGAADGRRKIGALARDCPLAGALTADELGRAVGRDHVVHAALTRAPNGRADGRPDGLAESLAVTLGRLDGFRTISDGDLENATGGCMQTSQNAGAGDQRMEKAKHGGQ